MSSSSPSVSEILARASKLASTDPKAAEALYKQILATSTSQSGEGLRDQETALVKLGELYRDQKYAEGLAEVINRSRAFMSSTAKAKTAKLIRTLLDYFAAIPDSQKVQMKALTDNIAWAKQEKRIFLKHSLETRLVGLQLESRQYQPALALIDTLLTELKRLDDKMILTEVHLLESRVYRGLGNMPKAKASLTSSRTAANAIYCPPSLQAQLDLQSGILHAEEKDYSTAYSYFFEAFENLSALGESEGGSGSEGGGSGGGKALEALKYMLLCKVMLNLPEDVNALLTIKLALRYASSRDVESMRAVARAHQKRDLRAFQGVLREYRVEKGADTSLFHYAFASAPSIPFPSFNSIYLLMRLLCLFTLSSFVLVLSFRHLNLNLTDADAAPSLHIPIATNIIELQSDPTIRTHLAALYDTLFEGNLKKIVEPYSVVEVAYVAEQVGQERQAVETKLSKMILDKVLYGVLDQGRGCLVIYDEPKADNTYGAAIETLEQISKVVESLYAKTVKIA
ncbi:hypothetical protein CVT25_010522 [Psilocybe cyanescens]|uniref:PCI domain-containing protein n=1 Tax=Psilocybe cyanescens TaxID=93625 RepID=A0A409X2L8_PSICY|nr:hypothetical protein CVT25_010522 [Psilocybe cyanescens]